MRLFFAYWPSPDKAAEISEWARRAHALYGGRMMRTDTLHMTLAFLGKADEETTRALVRACREWSLPTGDMLLHEPGCFRNAKVVWVGPGSPETSQPAGAGQSQDNGGAPAGGTALARDLEWLYSAQARLWQRLSAEGWTHTETGFRPHVSLLRNAAPAELGELSAPPVSWTPDRCVLVGSRPTESGSHYTMLAEIPLTRSA